ncbi:hypothetical protein COR50_06695 [Chitinophaga caeni]|uniref:DUF1361 domain-containing protein n=1 Tax=Chitinophaga caeni TaxID=2029983 RepID=A0A291QSP3_9BACT|nr:DUF1361 domain-containing protein [Chitinophaga caeni]ATL46893.1 hypothetical protein COR50_06695 [Chitinophaga caeni]
MKYLLSRTIYRWHKLSSFNDWVHVTALFAISLVVGKYIITGEYRMFSMIWNLFLAYIPYWISHYFLKKQQVKDSVFLQWIFTLSWFFFLPNAPYMITDLFHLEPGPKYYNWYDLLMLFSFAWLGLMLGFLSLYRIEQGLRKRFPTLQVSIFIQLVIMLNAMGIYIGRYLRWNSWDLVSNPFELFKSILFLIFRPDWYPDFWFFTICLTMMMALLYATAKKSPST